MNARILVVDDHEIVRKGVCKLIEESGRGWVICGEAESGSEAIDAAMTLNPDVIVLDISMPSVGGLEASFRITRLGLRSRVLLFTMYESKMLSSEARKAGAHGYVLKSQAARYLIMAIERLLEGGTFFGIPEPEPDPDEGTQPHGSLFLCLDWGFCTN